MSQEPMSLAERQTLRKMAEEMSEMLRDETWRREIEATRRGKPNKLEGFLRKRLDGPLAEQLIAIVRLSKRARRGNPREPGRFVGERQQSRRKKHDKKAKEMLDIVSSVAIHVSEDTRKRFDGIPRFRERWPYRPTPEHFRGPPDINSRN